MFKGIAHTIENGHVGAILYGCLNYSFQYLILAKVIQEIIYVKTN